MRNEIELEIQQMLQRSVSPHAIAKSLLARIGRERMTYEEKLSILHFAKNCGYYTGLFAYLNQRIQRQKKFPWALLVQSLVDMGLIYSDTLANHIFEGAQVTDGLEDLLNFRAWDHLDTRFTPLRASREKVQTDDFKKRKARLKEKVLFMQNQRLIEEERTALNKFGQMFPNDPFLKEQKDHFQERWAREIISRRASSAKESKFEKKINSLDEGQKKWVQVMEESLGEIITRRPERAYNLAIGLHMMNLSALAVKALQLTPKEENCDWLMIELLIHAGRPLDAINQIHEVELKYSSNPETSFGASYLRAIALWKLGQTEMAISFLQSILKIRPGYRSASSLISKWQGGALDT